MSVLTTTNIAPNQFNTRGGLMGSRLNKSELETIASNVVVISQWNGGWFSFTWDEYVKRCKHQATASERDILNQFVEMGLLSFKNNEYLPTDEFIRRLAEFII